MKHTVETLMSLAYNYADKYADSYEVEQDNHGLRTSREALRTALTEALGFRPDWADFENGRECGKLEVAQPVPPHECKTHEEKLAYAAGWWKALEANSTQPGQERKIMSKAFCNPNQYDGEELAYNHDYLNE